MPRPPAENPRTEQMNIRFTFGEIDALDAVAFLQSSENSKTEWARNVLLAKVEVARATDPRVDELIQLRIAARATEGSVLPPAAE